MNKKRRKEIGAAQAAVSQIAQHAVFGNDLEALKGKLEDLQREEEEAYDAMPESLQGSERGQASETAKDKLQEAVDKLQEIIDAFTEVDEMLNEIE